MDGNDQAQRKGLLSDTPWRRDDPRDRLVAELTRSNEALASVARAAAHDLQEPLRKIATYAMRLQERHGAALGPESTSDLERLADAAARMRLLIEGILQHALVAVTPPAFAATNLAEIVADVIGDVEVAIRDAGASVALGSLPTIEADPVQMRQLFQNLIANALKFRQRDVVPRITISAEAPSAGTVVIAVSDNGIGFEPRHADRIFGMFHRLHPRAAYDGSGIGLALCRTIVAGHCGTITAIGRPGAGATFRVALPAVQPHHEQGVQ